MSILRQTIRQLILEVDLGEKVWANAAPVRSRHRGVEPNTPIEQEMYDALYNWVNDEKGAEFSDAAIQAFIEASQDPRYNDVIMMEPGAPNFPKQIYRGSPISRSIIEDVTGLKGKDLFDAVVAGDTIDIEFSWDNQKFQRGSSKISSWTGKHRVAERFSGDNRHKIAEPISCIFHCDTTHPANQHAKFLNLSEIYSWGGFMNWAGEWELLAFSPPVVSKIEFNPECLVPQYWGSTTNVFINLHQPDFQQYAQEWKDAQATEEDEWDDIPF